MLIKCDNCGSEKYGPSEVQTMLNLSATSLNKFRLKGWIKSEYHSVGYLYTKESIAELSNEINRRSKAISYDTR